MKKSYLVATIILGIVTVADYFIPDIVPFVDEVIFTLATLTTGGIGIYKRKHGVVDANSETIDK